MFAFPTLQRATSGAVVAAVLTLCNPGFAQTSAPWPGLPSPFSERLTAAVRLDDGLFMLFNGSRAVVYTPEAEAPASQVIDLGLPVDAALRWSESKVLVFSGDETLLLGLDDDKLVAGEVSALGLPKDWDGVDGVAQYDATTWVFFRKGTSVLVPIPLRGEAVGWVKGIRLTDWFSGEWADGVDAAVSLGASGVFAVFRGDRFKVIDLNAGTITEDLPYSSSAGAGTTGSGSVGLPTPEPSTGDAPSGVSLPTPEAKRRGKR